MGDLSLQDVWCRCHGFDRQHLQEECQSRDPHTWCGSRMGPSHVHPFCVQVMGNATDVRPTTRRPIMQSMVWASLEVGPAVPGLACSGVELPCSQDTQNRAKEHDTASGKLPVARF